MCPAVDELSKSRAQVKKAVELHPKLTHLGCRQNHRLFHVKNPKSLAVFVDEAPHFFLRLSSSAWTKKALASRSISLAWRGSLTSRYNASRLGHGASRKFSELLLPLGKQPCLYNQRPYSISNRQSCIWPLEYISSWWWQKSLCLAWACSLWRWRGSSHVDQCFVRANRCSWAG